MSRSPSISASPRQLIALALLSLGAAGFVVALTIDDFWEAYPIIIAMLASGEIPEGEDAFAVSAILTLPMISFGPPALIVWLTRSRLLAWLLRVCAFITLGFIIYFLITQGADPEGILVVLTVSLALTFAGLCLVRQFPPPHPPIPPSPDPTPPSAFGI